MNAFGAAIEERQTGKGGNRQSENANQARQREVSRKRKGAPLKTSVQGKRQRQMLHREAASREGNKKTLPIIGRVSFVGPRRLELLTFRV
jgi:hypothetical protein